MTKDEALRLALEALETSMYPQQKQLQAITAIKAALEAKDEPDWKEMYEKEKRRSEMWVAKYEKDIGLLEKAVPQQEAKDERLELIGHADLAINNIYIFNGYGEDVPEGRTPLYAGYTTPPPVAEPHKRKPLTDETRNWIVATCPTPRHIIDAVERMHGIKGEA